jgi:hypothetical protein
VPIIKEAGLEDDTSSMRSGGRIFQVVPDETEREAYLILIVHGIGSNTEVQTHNKHDFDVSMNALIKGGYINS